MKLYPKLYNQICKYKLPNTCYEICNFYLMFLVTEQTIFYASFIESQTLSYRYKVNKRFKDQKLAHK